MLWFLFTFYCFKSILKLEIADKIDRENQDKSGKFLEFEKANPVSTLLIMYLFYLYIYFL